MRIYSNVVLIVLTACSSASGSKDSSVNMDTGSQPAVVAPDGSSTKSFDKSKLLGAWTNGNSENAIIDIRQDSIFYLDQSESFPYTLQGDSLTIVYPDMSFVGTAKFSGDTLILSDPEFGTTKFIRFKN